MKHPWNNVLGIYTAGIGRLHIVQVSYVLTKWLKKVRSINMIKIILAPVSITGNGKQARGPENEKWEQKQTWTLALLFIFCFVPGFHFAVPCSSFY